MSKKKTKKKGDGGKALRALFAPTVNVNLGCGTHIVPSTPSEKWINIDSYIGADTPDFLQGDCREIPLESKSVDYLLADNVFEHLAMCDVVPALHEVRRVLKKGGRAVIIVPDFKAAAESWLKFDWNSAFNPHFYHYESEVIYGNQMHEGEFHKTPFCAGYFSFVLKVAGFRNVKLIGHPQFGPTPNYPGVSVPNGHLRTAELVADIIKES